MRSKKAVQFLARGGEITLFRILRRNTDMHTINRVTILYKRFKLALAENGYIYLFLASRSSLSHSCVRYLALVFSFPIIPKCRHTQP